MGQRIKRIKPIQRIKRIKRVKPIQRIKRIKPIQRIKRVKPIHRVNRINRLTFLRALCASAVNSYDGRMTAEAKAVYEVILEHGVLDTVRLRCEARLTVGQLHRSCPTSASGSRPAVLENNCTAVVLQLTTP